MTEKEIGFERCSFSRFNVPCLNESTRPRITSNSNIPLTFAFLFHTAVGLRQILPAVFVIIPTVWKINFPKWTNHIHSPHPSVTRGNNEYLIKMTINPNKEFLNRKWSAPCNWKRTSPLGIQKKNLGNQNMSMIAPFLIDSLIENCSSFSLFLLSILYPCLISIAYRR